MSERKRTVEGGDRKKKKYRSDGTPIWGKRYIDGPGIWVSCVKGKEKQTVGELYDLFESVASELWPIGDAGSEVEDSNNDLSVEDQIAEEVLTIKRPKREPRFVNCQTNTPCVVFISCKPPIDSVKLAYQYIKNVQATGVAQTRYVHRLVPVSGSCVANLPEIQALCRTIFSSFMSDHQGKKFTYKIELRMRNHTTIPRPTLIQHIAQCVPEEHTVALENPEIFILVEVFKSICGMSVVEDYYRLQKFNVMEIAKSVNVEEFQNGQRFNFRADVAKEPPPDT